MHRYLCPNRAYNWRMCALSKLASLWRGALHLGHRRRRGSVGFSNFCREFLTAPHLHRRWHASGGYFRACKGIQVAQWTNCEDLPPMMACATVQGLHQRQTPRFADPFDVGHVFQPFADETISSTPSLSDTAYTSNITPTADFFPNAGDISAGTGGRGRIDTDTAETEAASVPVTGLYRDDWSIQQRGSLRHPADPVLVGRNPTQIYLPWKGNIVSASVWFDNGRREGIRYPSTCTLHRLSSL